MLDLHAALGATIGACAARGALDEHATTHRPGDANWAEKMPHVVSTGEEVFLVGLSGDLQGKSMRAHELNGERAVIEEWGNATSDIMDRRVRVRLCGDVHRL